jgi:CRISPR-associated endoribonuclease Cas6
LAEFLHDKGAVFEKRHFKLFTFSRLLGRFRLKGKEIAFQGPVSLWVASPLVKILESFASHFVKKEKIKLGNSYLRPTGVEVAFSEEMKGPVFVKTLSPITVYSTLQSVEGKKKTYYYSPFESDFSQLVKKNLAKKYSLIKEENSLNKKNTSDRGDSFLIKPMKVSNRNEHIIFFKGTVIKAWSGIYKMDGPTEYLQVAFDTGLGAKNSQGFGMIEKYCFREMS